MGAIRQLATMDEDELYVYAKELRAPIELVRKTKHLGRLPVVNFAAGGPLSSTQLNVTDELHLSATEISIPSILIRNQIQYNLTSNIKIYVNLKSASHLPEFDTFLIASLCSPISPWLVCRCSRTFSYTGGVATPADAALMMQMGVDGVFVGSGIFKSGDAPARARAIVQVHPDPICTQRKCQGFQIYLRWLNSRRCKVYISLGCRPNTSYHCLINNGAWNNPRTRNRSLVRCPRVWARPWWAISPPRYRMHHYFVLLQLAPVMLHIMCRYKFSQHNGYLFDSRIYCIVCCGTGWHRLPDKGLLELRLPIGVVILTALIAACNNTTQFWLNSV